ncbi:MAG: O-antigen ligase family protein [Psychroflexus halocasei]
MKAQALTNITKLLLFFAVFFLPLKTSLSNIGVIGLLFTHVLSFIFYGINHENKVLKRFLYFSPFILIVPVILGITYSPLPKEAFNEITKYIFLLIFPVMLFRKDLSNINFHNIIKKSLITGCLLSGLVLLSINFYNFSLQELPITKLFSSHFTGFRFLSPWGENLHPIYVGSYFIMSLSFIFFTELRVHVLLKIASALIIVTSIVFINSRIIFFSLLVLFFLLALEKLHWKVFAFTLTTLLIAAILIMPYFKQTYIYNKAVNGTIWELENNIGTHNTDTKTTSDSRMSRWIVGWELFKEKPILGHGSGTENEVLLEKYKENDMKLSVSQSYNAHNQILGYLIRFGLIGALSIIIFFIGNCYIALKQRDLVYISFFVLIGAIFCIENYVDRNMGINFIVLLGSTFLIRRHD